MKTSIGAICSSQQAQFLANPPVDFFKRNNAAGLHVVGAGLDCLGVLLAAEGLQGAAVEFGVGEYVDLARAVVLDPDALGLLVERAALFVGESGFHAVYRIRANDRPTRSSAGYGSIDRFCETLGEVATTRHEPAKQTESLRRCCIALQLGSSGVK